MKLSTVTLLCTTSIILMSGCAEIAPGTKKELVIDNTLPQVVLTKNGVITDMKTVAFEWQPIEDTRVEKIYVYKRLPDVKESSKLDYYDEVENRFSTHYIDRNVDPAKHYTYAFRVVAKNAQGRISKAYEAETRPLISSVSWLHSIAGLPRMAKIIWRPHSSERVDGYIIERRAIEDDSWDEVAKLSGRLNAEYIDEGLSDNHVYFYRIRVKTYDDLISNPSKVVKVVTKPLPPSISSITASKDLPKAIEISWSAAKIKDFSHYNLYRSRSVDGSYELIAKLHNNHFKDKVEENGEVYFYKVSVVDNDGLESEYDNVSAMGMSLPQPNAPTIEEAKFMGSEIDLKWHSNDARTRSYIVVRKAKKGWFDEVKKEFKGIKTEAFRDQDIAPDTLYSYTVYGVDENGLVSKPSTEVQIKTPESDKIINAPKQKSVPQQSTVSKSTNRGSAKTTIAPIDDFNLNEI